MLFLVPREVHEVPQPECLHHVRRVRQEFLLIRQGRLLPPAEERGEAGRPDGGHQLPDVPQQDRGGRSLCRPVLHHLLWDTSGGLTTRSLLCNYVTVRAPSKMSPS